MYFENKSRTIAKTLSWRVSSVILTTAIVYIFTRKLILAISIGGIDIIAKTAIYYLHERIWNKVNYGRQSVQPFVLWFTGLSGAGKSTLAERTYLYLQNKGLRVEQLDGDNIRTIFPNTGFSKEERCQHIKRVGFLASMLEKNNVIVIASFISPYQETRESVRKLCKTFLEVYVNTSLEICEKRDPKNLYRRARAGEIKNFTGIDDPYEPPHNPEITIITDKASVEESFLQIKNFIDRYLEK